MAAHDIWLDYPDPDISDIKIWYWSAKVTNGDFIVINCAASETRTQHRGSISLCDAVQEF